jgi:hypothetical protein
MNTTPYFPSWACLALLLACTGSDEDSSSTSPCATDNDTATPTDTSPQDTQSDDTSTTETGGQETAEPEDTGQDTGDVEPQDSFEVAHMGIFFDGAVLGGSISDWAESGVTQEGQFVLYVADDAWSGELDDEDHSCQLWFEISPELVIEESTFLSDGAWNGWQLDTSTTSFLGQMGTCETLDAGSWSASVSFYDYMSSFTWGIGVGSLDAEIRALLLEADDGTDTNSDGTTDLEEEVDLMVGGYVLTDLAGVAAVYPYNYGFVYELSSDGELTKDKAGKSKIHATASKSPTLVDGLYALKPGTDLPFWSLVSGPSEPGL